MGRVTQSTSEISTNQLGSTLPINTSQQQQRNPGILSPQPTPNKWSITKKPLTHTDISKLPDNQVVLVTYFKTFLETIENTCLNNEFHEEK